MTQPYPFPDRRRITFPRWAKWLLASVPLAGLAAGAARVTVNAASSVETRSHAESLFVRRDSLALWRQRDSLVQDRKNGDMLRILSGLDSSDRCRRGFRGYCR